MLNIISFLNGETKKLCNGLCDRIRNRFKGTRLGLKGLATFSCNHCALFLPMNMLGTMYWNDEEIIAIILNHRASKYGLTGQQRLDKLRENGRFCFCCGMKFSMSHKGSHVADKRDLLEAFGAIMRQ